MKHLKSLRFCALLLLLLLVAASLSAATVTTKYVILFDVDNSTSSGCTYTVGTTSISGIEHVLTTTVDRNGSSATVTGVERQQCSGGVLTTPAIGVDSTGWPATVGADGTLHVVTHMPNAPLGSPVPVNMRLYIGELEGLGASFVETTPNGSPILYPTIGPRRRAVSPTGNPAPEQPAVLNGSIGFFLGLPPMNLGTPVVTGTPTQQISNVFGLSGPSDIFFLINIGGTATGALVANDDSYTVQQGHGIGAGAPGVLTNDINTTGSPLLAQLLTTTHLGTLTLHADGSFHYANSGGPQTTDIFTYKATAGGQSSDPATVTFHIIPDNAPVGVTDAYTVAHAGTLSVPPPGVLTNDTDADHDPMTAVLNSPPSHASSFHLNSDGSFTYTHDGTNTLSDTFTYKATDGIIPSFPVTVNITVGPDFPPVPAADAYTTAEGSTLTVPAATGLLANDNDPDTAHSSLTATLGTPPAHGSVVVNPDGSFVYTHDGSETTSDTFTYVVTDGITAAAPATVTITITPVNDAPVLNNQTVMLAEDTPTAINVTATDAEGDALTYQLLQAPSHGSLSGTLPNVTYTPNANYHGTDSFVVVASDGKAQSSAATISLTITPVDDAPVAVNDVYAATPNATLTISAVVGVLANDSDVDGDSMQAIQVSGPSHASSFTLNPDGSFTYTPTSGYTGTDTFTYKAQETTGGVLQSNVATVTFNIHGTNAAPVANSQTVSTNEDTPLGITLTGSDPDGDAITFSANAPGHGVLAGTAPNLTYTPNANYNGSDSFTFTVSDGSLTGNGTVTINIAPMNDAPVAAPDVYGTLKNTTLNVSAANGVLLNDSDADGNALTAVLDTNVSSGTLNLNPDGSFTYTPSNNFAGTDTFTYHAFDGSLSSGIVTVTLNVKNTNTPPTANAQSVTTNEDTAVAITLTGSDPDADPLSYVIQTPPAHGTLSGAAPSILYTPAANYSGSDSFTFTVSDGIATSAAATVSITINHVNHAPVANNDALSTNEDAGVSGNVLTNDSDPDGDVMHAVLVGNVSNGTLNLNSDGSFTYTPNANFNGIDGFTYTANDAALPSSIAHVTINVGAVNDVPTFTAGSGVTVLDTNGAYSSGWASSVSAGPADEAWQATNFIVSNDNSSLFSVQPAISSSGVLTFTPIVGQSGVANVTVQLHDNGGTTNGGVDTTSAMTFAITVDKIPVITSANNTTFLVGTFGTFTTTASAHPPADFFESGALPTGVSFVNNGPPSSSSGTLSGTPAAGTGGVYNITFTATNVRGSSAPQAFTLTVNETPTIGTNPSSQAVCAGATATFTASGATGYPVPTVQWQISTDGGTTYNNIGGATSTTYSFATVAADDGHKFRAVFTNSIGSATTTAATLTVNTVPVVTTNPSSQVICAGSPVTFTAAATGQPAPGVQWQVSTDGGATFNDLGGATSTTLTFTTAAADTGKQYRARFTNVCGANVTTTAATLTVDTPAVVTTNPVSQVICAGAPVTFTAAATSNASDHTVQWQVSTNGGGTWTNIGGATTTTLTFTTATTDNGKQYRAVFADGCGNTPTTAATLTVDTLPVVSTNPVTQTICAGATVNFTAAATSNASDQTVQWQVSTNGGGTWTDIGGATSTTLSFATVAGDTGKQYRAVFTTVCGTATTTAATLTVDTLPVVTTNPATQTVCAGGTATFTAAATSNASDHTVQWQVSTNGGGTWTDIVGATTTTLSFTTATTDNGKQYRAVFTDVCGNTPTTAATLTVDTLPVVSTNPVTQTICAGGTVNFTAAATSNAGDQTVQWQVSTDGGTTFNDIVGATSTTLSFATVTGDNGKQYQAVFTTVCGTATTTAATLTVDTLPVVTTNPLTQTVCAGSTVNFTAAATSNASDHTVQWQVSTNGGGTWSDIVGATSTTLSFVAANLDNTKQYRAVFTDVCGNTPTSAAVLTVDSLPVVTTDPANQTVCSGAPVTFTAAATSNAGDHTVQWQVSTNSGGTWTDIGGATSTTLTFTPANSDTGSEYRAVFTDVCGSTPTAAATLSVDTLPVVTTNPATQTLCDGATATFTAAATSNASDHTVQWQVSTNGGGTWSDIVGATSTTLSFVIGPGDNGKQYRAVFTDSCGNTPTSAATLTVDSLPVVTTNPTTQTICAGSPVTFTAAATSNASDHTVQWQVSTNGGGTWTDIGGATSTTLSFSTAAGDNAKQYRAVFTSVCGSTPTSAATLTVDTLPVVTTNPSTQTICAGSPVTFTAAATSNASDHTVQWQVSTNGGGTWTDIGGATSTTLSFTTAAGDNGKQYRAVFTDVCGSANTTAATLTVDTLPVVTGNPNSQTVCAGASASFTAAATSNASDHTVQWQVSTNGGGTWTDIGGATSTTLSFTTVAGDNAKQYRAVFTDVCGSSTTTAATLTVDTLPVVTTNPVTQTVCAGGTASFTAAATSNASDHTVQWQVSTNGGGTWTDIGGATSTTLSFATVAGDNGKQYRAVFTDSCGSSNTTAAILTVDTLPVVSAQPSNSTVCAGALASFTSAATSNASDHTVQWQISIDGGGNWNNIGGATSTTYSFTTASDGSDSGHQYRAVFTDACGNTNSNVATLTVNTPPAVTGTPSSTTVCAGTLASFTASASGSPTPTVQWQVSIDGGTTFNNVVGATSATYSFSATAADTGKQYRAVFTNVCSTATTSAATLTVNTTPAVTTQPTNQSVTSGSTATFTAAASGTPSPTVQWQLSTDGGTTFNDIPGATSTTYTTPATALSDSGRKYQAVFTNSCGTATSNVATLTVTCPPITVARNGGGSFPTGTYNTSYSGQSVVASGGSGTYTFAKTSGNLPTGLSISSAGAISGTPTATGTFNFQITATDSNTNCTGVQSFSIQIKPAASGDSYGNIVNNTEAVVTGGATTSPATPFITLSGTIIANDLPAGGVAAVAGTVTSAQALAVGGSNNVTIAADGTFKYTPPVTTNALTTDSFTYTISSDTGGTGTPTTATGTVTLTLSGRVWYVKNNGSNGNGQSQSPFNSTSSFANAARVTPDKANDIIYIYNGDGLTTNQTSGVALLSGEQLIGEGVALVITFPDLSTATLRNAGTKPQITNSAATSDAVTLNDGNTVKGLTITGATRDGIAGSTHAGFTGDTLTISNNTSSALHFTSMTGTVTVTNATINGSNGTGLDVNNGTAAITLDATNAITAAAGKRSVSIQNRPASAGTIALGASITDNGTGILVNNNASGTINFTGTQTLTTTTNNAISLTTNTGTTINFSGTLNATTTTGNGLNATGGGTLTVSGTANVTTGAATNQGININGVTVGASGVTFNSANTTGAATGIALASLGNGNVTINSGTITNGTTGVSLSTLGTSTVTLGGSGQTFTITGPATAISGTSFGTLAIGGSSTVNVSGTNALNLTTGTISGTFNNVTATAGSVTLSGIAGTWGATGGTITGAAGSPAFGSTAGSATMSFGAAITQSNANNAVSVNTLASGSLTFSGNITENAAATGISLTNATGGTVTFSGTTKSLTTSTATAINISGNAAAHTMKFTNGGLAISTTTGAAIAASGAGTLEITGSTNTVNVTTGTAAATELNLSGITIGANGVTFQSVNITGGATGINLAPGSNVGTFTIAGAAGACDAVTTTCTGGTLQTQTTSSITNSGGTMSINNVRLLPSAIGLTTTGTSPNTTLNTVLVSGGTTSVSLAGGASASTTLTGASITGAATGITGTTFGTLTAGSNTTVSATATVMTLTTGTVNGTFAQLNGTIAGNTDPIVLSGIAGSFTVSGGTVTKSGGTAHNALTIAGGTATINWNGNLSDSTAAATVAVTATNTGNITFSGGTLTLGSTSTGLTFAGANGTYAVTSTVTCSSCANGITIGTSTGTFSFGAGIGLGGSSGTLISINGTTPVVLYAANITQTTAGKVVAISGVTGGSTAGIAAPYSILFSGTITKSTNAATAIDINGNSGGTVGFTNTLSLTTQTASAITVNGNSGGTYSFTGNTTISTSSGTGVNFGNTATNTGGTFSFTSGNLSITTTAGAGFIATSTVAPGATINVTGANNTITAVGGTGLSLTNTTIGGSNMAFKSISVDGTASRTVANGIVLNTTGSGTLTVAGDGTSTRNSTGGTIQRLSNNGISLTSTTAPSFSHVTINDTTHSGVKGTTTAGFTFQHGSINQSGLDSTNAVTGTTDDSNIAFNTTSAGTETNLTGVVTIKNNSLTNAYYRGIDIYNFAGNVSDGHIESNTITSQANTTSSKGAGIRWVTEKNATVTKNNIDSNAVNNFPTDVGIDVPCGTAGFLSGHTNICGTFNATPNTGPNIINITNNTILGSSAALPIGAEGIVTYCNTCNLNVNISGNHITNTKGQGISSSAFGKASVSAYIDNNVLVTHNTFSAAGIGVGTSFSSAAGAAEDPVYNTIISNNNISQNSGDDILTVARDVNGTLKAKIFSNTAQAPTGGVHYGVRVDSGNSNGNDTVCMNVFSNTATGAGGGAGIGMRRQSTNTNVFGVEGMAATSSPGVEQFVGNGSGKNPGSSNGIGGDGSVNGVLLISATTGFSNCSNGF
jgi:VCBS repeat-containing protein